MTAYPETRYRRRQAGMTDDTPRCSKCDASNDRAPQRYCMACNRTYHREWRRNHVPVPIETLTDEQRKRLRRA